MRKYPERFDFSHIQISRRGPTSPINFYGLPKEQQQSKQEIWQEAYASIRDESLTQVNSHLAQLSPDQRNFVFGLEKALHTFIKNRYGIADIDIPTITPPIIVNRHINDDAAGEHNPTTNITQVYLFEHDMIKTALTRIHEARHQLSSYSNNKYYKDGVKEHTYMQHGLKTMIVHNGKGFALGDGLDNTLSTAASADFYLSQDLRSIIPQEEFIRRKQVAKNLPKKYDRFMSKVEPFINDDFEYFIEPFLEFHEDGSMLLNERSVVELILINHLSWLIGQHLDPEAPPQKQKYLGRALCEGASISGDLDNFYSAVSQLFDTQELDTLFAFDEEANHLVSAYHVVLNKSRQNMLIA
jgi:hypothetical protein